MYRHDKQPSTASSCSRVVSIPNTHVLVFQDIRLWPTYRIPALDTAYIVFDQLHDRNTLTLGGILSPTQQFKTLTRPLPISTSCIIRLRPLPFLLSRPQQNKTLLRHLLRHLIRPQAKPACSYGIMEPLPRRSEGKEDGKSRYRTKLILSLSAFPCVSFVSGSVWALLGCGWVVLCTVGQKITVSELPCLDDIVTCGVVFGRLAFGLGTGD